MESSGNGTSTDRLESEKAQNLHEPIVEKPEEETRAMTGFKVRATLQILQWSPAGHV